MFTGCSLIILSEIIHCTNIIVAIVVVTGCIFAKWMYRQTFIVLDNSNIFIGLGNAGRSITNDKVRWRLNYSILLDVLRRPFFFSPKRYGPSARELISNWKMYFLSTFNSFSFPRRLGKAYAVVSTDYADNLGPLAHLHEAGFEVFNKPKVIERETGRVVERGVDERLQSIILDIVLDYACKNCFMQLVNLLSFGLFPDILVIATGDGNSDNGQHSFPSLAQRALKAGMRVEVAAWKNGLSGNFKNVKGLKIRYLDDNMTEFTFQQ